MIVSFCYDIKVKTANCQQNVLFCGSWFKIVLKSSVFLCISLASEWK